LSRLSFAPTADFGESAHAKENLENTTNLVPESGGVSDITPENIEIPTFGRFQKKKRRKTPNKQKLNLTRLLTPT
jgi:hypothetical protein